ncbi:hypothetical protein KUTeg_024213 [Tegillarca granosa]|uniref:Uncharacterized protein n=1 Tax=Tegillarca granosa TaxID=220873 RepID=A0ABQ9DXE0_TEGGR|nr:hypothetical protein KUTeg_024213 [Tegillarca granosa]
MSMRLADSESKNDELTAQIEYLWEIIREGRGFGSSQLEKAISYHKDLEKKYQQKELKWKKMLKNQDLAGKTSIAFERLSKLAGSKLTQNNPGITDLSDSNRESKLAEQLSELYDTEWTDAFKELTESGLSDNEAIFVILDILKSAYSFCCNIAEKYETGLFKSPSHLPVLEVIQHRVPDIQMHN